MPWGDRASLKHIVHHRLRPRSLLHESLHSAPASFFFFAQNFVQLDFQKGRIVTRLKTLVSLTLERKLYRVNLSNFREHLSMTVNLYSAEKTYKSCRVDQNRGQI